MFSHILGRRRIDVGEQPALHDFQKVTAAGDGTLPGIAREQGLQIPSECTKMAAPADRIKIGTDHGHDHCAAGCSASHIKQSTQKSRSIMQLVEFTGLKAGRLHLNGFGLEANQLAQV
ncbi:MAG: hypothetical protein F4X16_17205, partial [Caldilineaceae bacterium SB0661_bin_34]|nr:hypothetical protein [Caldilineaceae bacterium SB0661_bin_34]